MKFVLNLDLQNDKDQQRRALKTISTLSGIDEISIDLKGKKLTVIGTVDPVSVVSKLRKKSWPAQIISVGPAKEPEKKEEPKKEEPKKEEAKKEEEPKKEEAKKEEEPKKEEAKKEEAKEGEKKEEPKKEEEKKPEPTPEMMHHQMMQVMGTGLPYRPYRPYYPPVPTYYPVHHSMEENPNACIIS
ncbi:heavy metal-associated isoprenylated plant protein 39-like isoform X2 [Salvia hispanica]|uniref:heavy metal-associated isoprenylated plant protein 39-like isoform X2 n=1 Tax=Salvia hispanica TaxID=49212 RepID=UPI00200921D2|nr:heavy metal-associated isoprenylated plant protein 39-like isoform X2 [Salvia hispanica]